LEKESRETSKNVEFLVERCLPFGGIRQTCFREDIKQKKSGTPFCRTANRGLAQAGHYLAWRNFCGKEKIILSRASLLEAPPAPSPRAVSRHFGTAQSRKKKYIEMKNIYLITNFRKIFLFLSLISLGVQFCYGQERENKINTIIDSLEMVQTQKLWLLTLRLEPLKYMAIGEDSIRLIAIENLLTDQEIKKRIFQSFDEIFTNDEINELYRIITSSVLYKLYKSSLLSNSLENQFKDINSELDLIAGNYENKNEDVPKFEPIHIEKEDGFYAVIDYEPNRKENISLEKNPAITKKDILEVKKGTDNSSIDITFNKDGTKKFYLLTKNNIGKHIAIVIDKYIVSIPKVFSAISGGKAVIGGDFTEGEVENMIRKLSDE
jgi:hypothetical protein